MCALTRQLNAPRAGRGDSVDRLIASIASTRKVNGSQRQQWYRLWARQPMRWPCCFHGELLRLERALARSSASCVRDAFTLLALAPMALSAFVAYVAAFALIDVPHR